MHILFSVKIFSCLFSLCLSKKIIIALPESQSEEFFDFQNNSIVNHIVIGNTAFLIMDTDSNSPIDIPRGNFDIQSISEDSEVRAYLSWGLDRIDQASLPLDNLYSPNYTGKDVNVYVMDTGCSYTHKEFTRVKPGWSAVSNDPKDDHGHGTHVSSTISGKTVGVSRDANIIPVKILNSGGGGSWIGVLRGLEWVSNHHKREKACSIISMSIGGSKNEAVNKALDELSKAGIVIVVASGNERSDACNSSPSSCKSAITVGASSIYDVMAGFSNTGSCVDIIAPGVDILGADYTGNSKYKTLSGTSMATPHVSGIMAQLLEKNGCADIQTSIDELLKYSSKGVLKSIPVGTPNILSTILFNQSVPVVSCRCRVIRLKSKCDKCDKRCKWSKNKCLLK